MAPNAVTKPERAAPSITGTFVALIRAMSERRRRHLVGAVAAMVAGAVAELMTIGAVLPFLALVSDPTRVSHLPGYSLFLLLAGEAQGPDLLIRAASLLIAATIVAAAARLMILWVIQGFVVAFGHDIGTAIFNRMLRQPYAYYVTRNSSELLSSIEKVQYLTFGTLLPLMQGITASLLALAIVALLFALDPFAASIAAVSVVLLYALVSVTTQPRLKANSAVIAETATARMKAIQEGMGGIRDILLANSQSVFEENFRKLDLRFRRAQSRNIFIAVAPRYVVEGAGIVLIVLVALAMSFRPGGIMAAIPVLGALALGAQRLLPLIQQAYQGWSNFAGNSRAMSDVLALMQTPVVATAPSHGLAPEPFATDIVLDRVSLSYPGRPAALSEIELSIAKGERIGLVGTTGSGKSSFLDVLMGLLDPSEGEIRIDGVKLDDSSRSGWQAQIAHVPQSIYLADNSIAANIAFAEPEETIDLPKVEAAARLAQLHDFIAGLPEAYATRVGDRGVRLSGGQRQRIAIARALYKQASVLIFDEATGALDRRTERAIMESVAELGREITVLIVAHRISALAGCDRIVRLEGGRIAESGSYKELVGETA
ncbi:MAG: ABC transporter ATP-binding protein [Allosphingosinicella sp.]